MLRCLILFVALLLGACVPKTGALPERREASIAKGDRAYAKGDLAKAEKHYGRAIEAGGPEAGDARYLRARVRLERGDLAGAESDALAVLAATPLHWEAMCIAGMVREKQGRRAEAIDLFRRATQTAPPGELAPRNNLAWLELQDGRHREAYDRLVEIVRDHPESARAWSNLALAADELGLAEEAARARETAARIAEDDAQDPGGGSL